MSDKRRSTENDRSNAFFLIRAKWSAGQHEEALKRAKKRIDQLVKLGDVAEYVELMEMVNHSEDVASITQSRPSTFVELEREIRRRVNEAWPEVDAGQIANDVRYEFDIPNVSGDRKSNQVYRMTADYIEWRRRKHDGQERMRVSS